MEVRNATTHIGLPRSIPVVACLAGWLGVAAFAPVAGAQANRGPILHVDSTQIRWPDLMLSARVGGTARVNATIDSAGSLVRTRVRVVEETHPLFGSAAKAALHLITFEPRHQDGRDVAASFEIEIDFKLPLTDTVPVRSVWRVDTVSTGFRIITGWDPVTRVVPEPVLSNDDMLAAREAVLATVRREVTLTPADRIELSKVTVWTPNVIGTLVETVTPSRNPNGFGASGHRMWCQASRENPSRPWIGRCTQHGVWVSFTTRASDLAPGTLRR